MQLRLRQGWLVVVALVVWGCQAWGSSPPPATTPFTRGLLTNNAAVAARSYLGIVTSNWAFNTDIFEAPGNVLDIKGDSIGTNKLNPGLIADLNTNHFSVVSNVVTKNLDVRMRAQPAGNVQDFGAVGDGTTDDTAAVQRAIDYVVYTNRGSRVYVPTGKYRITDTLNPRTSGANSLWGTNCLEIAGDGAEKTILLGAVTNKALMEAAMAEGVRMSGLTIRGINFVGPLCWETWNTNSTAQGLVITRAGGYVGNDSPGVGILIDRCSFRGWSNGVALRETVNTRLESCDFYTNHTTAVHAYEVDSLKIHGGNYGWMYDTNDVAAIWCEGSGRLVTVDNIEVGTTACAFRTATPSKFSAANIERNHGSALFWYEAGTHTLILPNTMQDADQWQNRSFIRVTNSHLTVINATAGLTLPGTMAEAGDTNAWFIDYGTGSGLGYNPPLCLGSAFTATPYFMRVSRYGSPPFGCRVYTGGLPGQEEQVALRTMTGADTNWHPFSATSGDGNYVALPVSGNAIEGGYLEAGAPVRLYSLLPTVPHSTKTVSSYTVLCSDTNAALWLGDNAYEIFRDGSVSNAAVTGGGQFYLTNGSMYELWVTNVWTSWTNQRFSQPLFSGQGNLGDRTNRIYLISWKHQAL